MTLIKRVTQAPSDGRAPIQYRIQLVDKPLVEEATNFMIKNFLPAENLCASIGLLTEKNAAGVARSFWEKQISKGISLAAFLEDNDGGRGQMISCNVLEIERRNHAEDFSKIIEKSEKWRAVFRTIEDVEAEADVFSLYDCEAFVHAFGLSVAADYERRGIGAEMLAARAEICKRTDTPVTATLFTGGASQRLAERCGYETLAELDLVSYRIDGQVIYPQPKWPIVKWMARSYF